MSLQNKLKVSDRIGKLTILSLQRITDTYQKIWLCKCDCGNEVEVKQACLRRKNFTQSCGCIRKGHHKGAYLAKRDPIKVVAGKIYKKRYSDGDLSLDDFIKLSQEPCHYCGRFKISTFNPYLKKDGTKRNDQRISERRIQEMTWSYNGLDRKDNTKGHTLENSVTCCKTCNYMKRDMSYEDFLAHCKRIIKWIN